MDNNKNLPVAVIGTATGGSPAAVAPAEVVAHIVLIERGSEVYAKK